MLKETDRPAQAGAEPGPPAGARSAEAGRRIWLAGLLTAALVLVLPQRAGAQPSVSVQSAELEVRDPDGYVLCIGGPTQAAFTQT